MFTDDPPQVVEIERKIRAIFFPPDATAPAYDFGHIMLALNELYHLGSVICVPGLPQEYYAPDQTRVAVNGEVRRRTLYNQ